MSLVDTLSHIVAQAGEGNALMGMLPIILMFVILYFLMIRPQMKRQKEHRNMVAALAKGDEIITTGGMLGKVTKASPLKWFCSAPPLLQCCPKAPSKHCKLATCALSAPYPPKRGLFTFQPLIRNEPLSPLEISHRSGCRHHWAYLHIAQLLRRIARRPDCAG